MKTKQLFETLAAAETMMETHSLACSEVWGGNDEVLRAVSMPGLDAYVLSKPYAGGNAGGDVHYLSSCATGRIGRVLIADVAGHGEQVAALAIKLRAILRKNVNYVDQSRVMAEMNREFAAAQRGGSGLARFATAIVATFWGPTGELDLTIAGHPPPMLYRAATDAWELVEARSSDDATTDVPLGILDASTYTRQRVGLRRGDLLVLYTDALMEASSGGTALGTRGLLDIARGVDVGDAKGVTSALLQGVRQKAGSELDDDATVMVLQLNAIPPVQGSLARGLATSGRLIKEFVTAPFRRERFAWPEVRADNLLGAYFERWNKK
jgi:phosphoserine phosphatase RsbU/P